MQKAKEGGVEVYRVGPQLYCPHCFERWERYSKIKERVRKWEVKLDERNPVYELACDECGWKKDTAVG